MTLSKLLSRSLIAGLLSLTVAAEAYVVPGSGGDNYGPIREYHPGYGNDYGPQPGDGYGPRPGNPHPGYGPGYPPPAEGTRITRVARVRRQVRNEVLALRRLADIDRNYRGFRVEAVRVDVRPNRYGNASLQLLINRRVEDERSVYNEYAVNLYPRGYSELGDDANALQLGVRGEVYIEQVTIDLVRDSGGGYQPPPPPPPGHGREIVVDLPLPGYMPPQSRLDLTPYIDIRRYRGMTLVAVEVTANARYNAAVIEVLVNSFNEGTISLSRYTSTERVNSRQRLVLGESFGNLVLAPRGDSNITAVRLILRR